ncbi:MAG: SEL1-like repeat protein [Firmicutes bacterium]|nr:SEL1-like repeat protein [Bacillota bacterium]
MGLFSRTIEGDGWSFDKKTGKLTINGELGQDPFKDIKSRVLSVEALPGARITNGFFLFSHMENLKKADLAELDVSDCDTMDSMFLSCRSLTRIDLKAWKVSKTKDMSWLFCKCGSLKEVDLSSWDVSGVEDFNDMFDECCELETVDLTGWKIRENAEVDMMFTGVPNTVHVYADDASVVRLLPEGVKPDPHGTAAMRFNTALAVDNAGDYEEAARQYRLAAEQGSGAAAFNLAVLYNRGEGVPKDKAESHRWFMRAAEMGLTDAMYIVSDDYFKGGPICEKDYEQALYWARKAKAEGDLSEVLSRRKPIDDLIRDIENNIAFDAAVAATKAENYEEAAKQYRISAEKGSGAAAWNLAIRYASGKGVPKDPVESFVWRRRAAEMGNARAMYYLAELYHSGKTFVEQDDEQALEWAKKAQKSGNLPPDKPVDDLIREIERSLGEDPFNEGKHWLQNGDPAAAVHYFKIAAEQGNVSAAWTLGSIYAEGRHREKDDAEAFRWFMKAAELGHGRSMYSVANSYYTGAGVKKDLDQALEWAGKAKEAGTVPPDLSIDKLILKIETDIIICKVAETGWDKETVQQLVVAEERGGAAAAAQLAKLYLNGEGVEKDRALALHYYAQASEKGDTEASSFLMGQDIGDMFQEAADAYDRGDRSGALHIFHAAFRGNELRDHHCMHTMLFGNDIPYFRKLVQISAELFAEEGSRGTAWADRYLGQLYWESSYFHRNGNIPKDPFSAVPLYEKAMEEGSDQALEFMAVRTYLGDCPAVSQDRYKAAALLSRAARSEDPEVRYSAAFRYMTGYPEKKVGGETVYVDIEPEKAVELMTELAKEGHSGAMYDLAHMYDPENERFPNDPDKRLEYAKRAAELGHADAVRSLDYIEQSVAEEKLKAFVARSIKLGDDYYYGENGKDYDIFSAIDHYEDAAEYDADTAYKLARIFDKGDGIGEDKEEAVRWFTKAAELGNDNAQADLGYHYDQGDGVPQDYEKAAKWYLKAANAGHMISQYNIGLMYIKGQGVRQSSAEAKWWFEKAGEQKFSDAWLELGNIYYNETVDLSSDSSRFKESNALAKKYYKKAAELGNEKAKRYLRML